MTREDACKFCRDELNKHGLKDWGVRLNQSVNWGYLGMCMHKDRCIVLSAHHIDIQSDPDIKNTIRHEVAHALTPGQGHSDVWKEKARAIGCDNTQPCSNLTLPLDVIDAVRSGATVEVSFEEEVIRHPKYKITRLQDKCEICGKVAKSLRESVIESYDETTPDQKFIFLECGHLIVKNIPKGTPFHLLQTGGDPNCSHKWEKNKCILCGRFRPYDFQLEGMKFLEAGLAINKGAACFDEMGLGKTIQSFFLKFHPELFPVLQIVKSKTKYQWFKANVDWMGDEFVFQVINGSNDYLIPGMKGYIVGYDMLVHKVRVNKKTGKEIHQGFDISKFEKVGIKTVILDECQQIKNPDSSRTQMVRRVVKNTKVIALSGTPWKNRGSELFPVFNMLDPYKFHSQEGFVNRWVEKYWEGNRLREGGIRYPDKFREYVKDICIRRERTEVMKELPLVNRMKLHVQLDENESRTYDEEAGEFVKWYNSYVLEGREDELNGMNILAKMAKMRHIIALAKIPYTVEFAETFLEETDRKLIIFTHHIDVMKIMVDELKQMIAREFKDENIPVFKLEGGMDAWSSNEVQTKFNNTPRCILVASTLAAGESFNLQTCADCVMHERQWNPGNEEQAEGRMIRIGQMHDSISATYAEADDSVDVDLDIIVERKRGAFHRSMNKGKAPEWNETAFAKELAASVIARFNKKHQKTAA